ncbi:flagellar hook-length control protein FliK [Frateuria aurantia]
MKPTASTNDDTDDKADGSDDTGNSTPDASALAALIQWSGAGASASHSTATAAGTASVATSTGPDAATTALRGQRLAASMSTADLDADDATTISDHNDAVSAQPDGTTGGTNGNALASGKDPAVSTSLDANASTLTQLASLPLASLGKSLTHTDPGTDDGSLDPALLASQAAIGTGSATAATPAQPTAITTATVAAEVGSPAFASQLSQSVSTLVKQDIQQARIQVNPQGLGPIDIQLAVSNGVVDVSFAVQHPATVHAIQQTLPQLDSLMSSQGLQLGQAQVGHQSGQSSSQSSGYADENQPASEGLSTTSSEPASIQPVADYSRGLIMLDQFV